MADFKVGDEATVPAVHGVFKVTRLSRDGVVATLERTGGLGEVYRVACRIDMLKKVEVPSGG